MHLYALKQVVYKLYLNMRVHQYTFLINTVHTRTKILSFISSAKYFIFACLGTDKYFIFACSTDKSFKMVNNRNRVKSDPLWGETIGFDNRNLYNRKAKITGLHAWEECI